MNTATVRRLVAKGYCRVLRVHSETEQGPRVDCFIIDN